MYHPWIISVFKSRSRDVLLEGLGLVSVSISASRNLGRSRSHSRVGLGLQGLVYIPGINLHEYGDSGNAT